MVKQDDATITLNEARELLYLVSLGLLSEHQGVSRLSLLIHEAQANAQKEWKREICAWAQAGYPDEGKLQVRESFRRLHEWNALTKVSKV